MSQGPTPDYPPVPGGGDNPPNLPSPTPSPIICPVCDHRGPPYCLGCGGLNGLVPFGPCPTCIENGPGVPVAPVP